MDPSTDFRPRAGLFAMLLCLFGLVPASAFGADVRILIDVSGSMKQNDPRNLRIPAMRLMSELLPGGTQAGVWLFDGAATPLVATATVDETWRALAREALPRIHSRGQFTHIEQALAAAMGGWESSSAEPGERHVILLTDGVVDVSKDADESAASRARILSTQLDDLIARGVQVHAIALSDAVDKALIEKLTGVTGGWMERASDAARLQRIFLHMLEQTAPPVTVPIEGNRFTVDSTVSEFTLLVFRDSAEPVTLYQPDGSAWLTEDHPATVSWRHEAGYDLVTVSAPAAGEWRFTGTEDPDNRAVVVTDLALETDPIPPSMMASARLPLAARLTAAGAPVARVELLQLVGTRAVLSQGSGNAAEVVLDFETESLDYRGELIGADIAPGIYELTITADGGSFKRQRKRRLRLAADPVRVDYVVDESKADSVAIKLMADAELTRPATLDALIEIGLPSGESLEIAAGHEADQGAGWQFDSRGAGEYRFAPRIYVESTDGHMLRLEPEAQTFTLVDPPPPPAEPPPEPELPPKPPFSWLRFVAYVSGANVLLALALGGIWFMFGRAAKAEEQVA